MTDRHSVALEPQLRGPQKKLLGQVRADHTLKAILTPTEEATEKATETERLKNESTTGDLTSEGADTAHPSSVYIKYTYLGLGLIGFLTIGMTIAFLVQYKHYDVLLGSDLLNQGERTAPWNLAVLIGIGAPALGLFRMLAVVGCMWTPAMVGLYSQRVSGLRVVISLFSVPVVHWTIMQMLGTWDVIIIVSCVCLRLAVIACQHQHEMYVRYWMDAVVSESPSEDKKEAAYSAYGLLWAFFFLVASWWPAILFGAEVWGAHVAPLSTVQTIQPAIANHFWITVTTIFVGAGLELIAFVAYCWQYVPNYMDYNDGSWKETVTHKMRLPHVQENVQVWIRFLLEMTCWIFVFTAMYTCADGVTSC